MEDSQFKKAELEDKEIISHYFKHHTSRSCERTFVNVYLWSRQYPVKWAVIEGALVFKSQDEDHLSYAFPAGEVSPHIPRFPCRTGPQRASTRCSTHSFP